VAGSFIIVVGTRGAMHGHRLVVHAHGLVMPGHAVSLRHRRGHRRAAEYPGGEADVEDGREAMPALAL